MIKIKIEIEFFFYLNDTIMLYPNNHILLNKYNFIITHVINSKSRFI